MTQGQQTVIGIDVLAAGAIIATIIGWLPFVAAAAGLVWYLIQIWESRTVQIWHYNRKIAKKTKKIASLKARAKIIGAQLEALEIAHSAAAVARERVKVARVEATQLMVAQDTKEEEACMTRLEEARPAEQLGAERPASKQNKGD